MLRPAASSREKLPQEEVRSHEPAQAQEEAEVKFGILFRPGPQVKDAPFEGSAWIIPVCCQGVLDESGLLW